MGEIRKALEACFGAFTPRQVQLVEELLKGDLDWGSEVGIKGSKVEYRCNM